MARSDTLTSLPLDRYAALMGMNPLHFNGVVSDVSPVTVCGQPMMQFDWQAVDAVSRESLAWAIADAEQRIAQYLKFKLLPTFEFDERHSMGRPAGPEAFRSRLIGPSGLGAAIRLDWGHVVAGGIERRELVTANAPVVYTDDDADGYLETATVTVSTSATDPNEIALVMPGEGGDALWEIRPIKVSISSGICVIVARREQLVIPAVSLGFATGARAVDGADPTMFLPSIDVYRVWHDPSQQVQFLWESPAWGGCGCGGVSCQTCYLSAQFGCSVVRDYRLGLIAGTPAIWNTATSAYEFTQYALNRAPDRARFWYRAGYRNQRAKRPMVEMAPQWERAVAMLATTLLERPFCGCSNVENITRYWRDDLAVNSSDTTGGSSNRTSNKWLDNPLGTARGAVHAWRIIKNEALGEAA